MGIIHRDLKPENVLLRDKDKTSKIKIIDFGTSAIYNNKTLTMMAGTVIYMAPEVIKKKYSTKADIWSIGVILYVMLIGKPPFSGFGEEELFQNILTGKLDFKDPQC